MLKRNLDSLVSLTIVVLTDKALFKTRLCDSKANLVFNDSYFMFVYNFRANDRKIEESRLLSLGNYGLGIKFYGLFYFIFFSSFFKDLLFFSNILKQ